MQILIKTITPEVAAVMLENNPANRNIKRNHVDAMARDMAAGRWQTNGDAIRMNRDGSLIDGQHRLAACVKSGVPFQTVFISDLAAERDAIFARVAELKEERDTQNELRQIAEDRSDEWQARAEAAEARAALQGEKP